MIQSFADQSTQDVYDGSDTKAARMLPQSLWRVMFRKLDAVHHASALHDLQVPPGNRLEKLVGDHVGRHSIRVNDRYRITFRWEDGNAYDVRCEDYH